MDLPTSTPIRPSTENWRRWHEKDKDFLYHWLQERLAERKFISPTAVQTEPWHEWLLSLFPHYFQDATGAPIPFAPFHAEFWDWVWALRPGVRPSPFIAIWARGSGKSTTAEMACVALGARHVRRYAWYVSSTQDLADDHVNSIGSLLESAALTQRYPTLADRKISKFGRPRAWRRNRLWTAAGLIVDALGLDTASRGVKVEDARPDLLIFDDIDFRASSMGVQIFW
jgi:hypothetical protein